jgi:hypothetical protein
MGQNQTNLTNFISSSDLTKQITNILTSNVNNVSNIITLSNDYTVDIDGKTMPFCTEFYPNGNCKTQIDCPITLNINQNNTAKVSIAVKVTDQTTNQIKLAINNSLSNSASQAYKLMQGFLAGLGSNNSDNISDTIQTEVQNVINNTVTTNNLNTILNKVDLSNKSVLKIRGDIPCVQAKVLQSNTLDYQSSAILTSITSNIQNSSIVNDIKNTVSQSSTTTQKGFDALISALTMPLFIMGIVFLLSLLIGGGAVIKKALNWKTLLAFLVFILVAIGGYIIYMAIAKKGFFAPKQETQTWVCATDPKTGFNTDPAGCVQLTDQKDIAAAKKNYLYVYNSAADCQNGINKGDCAQYWGCDLDDGGYTTGGLIQCKGFADTTNPSKGIICPYRSSEDATTSKNCQAQFMCTQTTDAKGDIVGNCLQINPGNAPDDANVFKGDTKAQALASCTAGCSTTSNSVQHYRPFIKVAGV